MPCLEGSISVHFSCPCSPCTQPSSATLQPPPCRCHTTTPSFEAKNSRQGRWQRQQNPGPRTAASPLTRGASPERHPTSDRHSRMDWLLLPPFPPFNSHDSSRHDLLRRLYSLAGRDVFNIFPNASVFMITLFLWVDFVFSLILLIFLATHS